jgi:hypothetical protein
MIRSALSAGAVTQPADDKDGTGIAIQDPVEVNRYIKSTWKLGGKKK